MNEAGTRCRFVLNVRSLRMDGFWCLRIKNRFYYNCLRIKQKRRSYCRRSNCIFTVFRWSMVVSESFNWHLSLIFAFFPHCRRRCRRRILVVNNNKFLLLIYRFVLHATFKLTHNNPLHTSIRRITIHLITFTTRHNLSRIEYIFSFINLYSLCSFSLRIDIHRHLFQFQVNGSHRHTSTMKRCPNRDNNLKRNGEKKVSLFRIVHLYLGWGESFERRKINKFSINQPIE